MNSDIFGIKIEYISRSLIQILCAFQSIKKISSGEFTA